MYNIRTDVWPSFLLVSENKICVRLVFYHINLLKNTPHRTHFTFPVVSLNNPGLPDRRKKKTIKYISTAAIDSTKTLLI